MKKVIAMVVCVAMLACFALTASAATKATFTVSTVEGKKGDVVDIDITIAEEDTGIGTLEILVKYDTENLKLVKNKGKYFTVGAATNGASAVGNEENMKVAFASVDGFYEIGKVLTMSFEVLNDIAEGDIAEVTFEVTSEASHYEDNSVKYDIAINAGGVKAPAPVVVPPVDGGEGNQGGNNAGNEDTQKPVVKPVVKPEVEDVTVTDTEANPETGDVSGIAVATGLCAVMAAAFVITKKVND